MAFRCHASCDTLWLGSDWFIQSNQSGEPVMGLLGALPRSFFVVSRMWRFQEFQILGWMKFRWTSKSNTIGTKRCVSLCFCFGAMCFLFLTNRNGRMAIVYGMAILLHKLSTANLTPLICLSFWIATSLVTLQPKKHTPGRNFTATNPLAHGFRFGRPSKNHWMRTSWYWH